MTDHPPVPWPTLDLDRCGDATGGSDVIYLHGFGEDKHDLTELVGRTLPHRCAGWLPTLRGHGNQTRPGWGYTPGDLAADLQRSLTWSRQHVVVGYSFGAIVASAYALAVGPDRVKGLVVIDQAYECRPDRSEDGEWAEAVYMKWQYDYRHHLLGAAALGIPVLLVHGRESSVVTDEEKAFWATTDVPGMTTVTVGGKHVDLVHGPCTAAAVIAPFLAGSVIPQDLAT